ncbi:hypothetical protein, partial [Pseudomonas sp. HMSC75E02]|uniref:hypothetical protein n=1 Tax=Pseudomonas sp. HMSC75E02 TaxID=1608908 RepID=UPI001C44A43E
ERVGERALLNPDTCTKARLNGWVELAIPMRPGLMGIASLNPSYAATLSAIVGADSPATPDAPDGADSIQS